LGLTREFKCILRVDVLGVTLEVLEILLKLILISINFIGMTSAIMLVLIIKR